MKQIVLLLVLVFCSYYTTAQVLKGSVVGTNGEPIPYATIFIRENTLGIIANEQGRFQTKLDAGTYSCEVRSIGFETQIKRITLTASGAEIKVVLPEKVQNLKELTVKVSKEDPAYRVMRNAVARAPYHLYQVASYNSENYLKGSAKIEKLPTLMKMMIRDNKIKSLIGKLLVLESQNEITYQMPAKYTQKVIAYKSSIPKDMEPKGGIRISTSSIYGKEFDDVISPLSVDAFRYYKFKFEDIFTNGNYQVNKIKVTPKVKSDKLFTGYLYILEDNWSVFSADLSSDEMGTTTRYKIQYQEVSPTVFMPITYDMYTNIGTMGVKGYARFYSSVKYKKIKINESIVKVEKPKVPQKPIATESKKTSKTLAGIEKLSSKEKLSTRDALKLARLMRKAVEPQEVEDKRKALEIKSEELVKMEIDSLASKRDSTFWEDIRNVPLQADEAESFSRKDSLPASKSLSTTNNSVEFQLGGSKKNSVLRGGSFKLGKLARLQYNGLLRGVLKEYNFIDGAWLGQKFTFAMDSLKSESLYISPSIYYTTARNSFVWDVSSYWNYAPLSIGQLYISFGNTTVDIQGDKGIGRLFNSVSSLFFGDNAIRFYQKKYFSLENKIDIANGLRLVTGAAYERRQLPENRTNYHFFGNAPSPNYPDDAYRAAFPDNSATTVWIKLEYTPFYQYRIQAGRKQYVTSSYPTFGFQYKKAMNVLSQTEHAQYDKMDWSISQNVKLSEFNSLKYKLTYGAFLTNNKLFAPDCQYFVTAPLLLTNRLFDDGFILLDNYTSSSSRWMEAHINWSSDYLLLKRLGFLQKKQFNESLQLNTLWNVRNEKPYTELGYSIGFNSLGRVGVFCSFNGSDYQKTGIKISFPLFSMFGLR